RKAKWISGAVQALSKLRRSLSILRTNNNLYENSLKLRAQQLLMQKDVLLSPVLKYLDRA
ncbi:hypothetical protein, partial [Radiobacillus sp. PE A8.2]|uniref:hypothetical protein n=1 Tax=Radiobacillus sp. PE A8.2 TaxID=3380349 RepID=UPI00388D8296